MSSEMSYPSRRSSKRFACGRWMAVLAVAGTALPVYAQTLPAIEEGPDAVEVAAPTTAPASLRNGNGDGGIEKRNGGLILNFQDTSIEVVLDELSAVAGFIVVKEVRPTGRVTLTSRQPVSNEDAVSLLNTVLLQAGYGAIQQGRILKIVPRDQAKRLNIPVRSGNDPNAIEPTDELITQVIPLRYADAMELRQDLQPLINPQADFTSNASSNVLVITDTAANIRRMVQIIAALDTSLADAVEVKVFQLKYANASNAATLINSVFGDLQVAAPDQENGPGARWRRFQRQQEEQPQQGKGVRGTKVQAAADDRTNSVVVTGPVDTLGIVEEVIRELDENPVADETVFVYRLRNAQAVNLEAVVNNLFGNTTTSLRGTQTQTQGSTLQRSSRSRSSSGSTIGGGSRTIGGGGAFAGGGTQGGAGRFSQQQQQRGTGGGFGGRGVSATAAQTAADLANQVTIIADPDTNSMLVRTVPANYERVKAVLAELDRPVAQVLIKVLVAEVTHDNEIDFGAEFSVLNIRASGQGQSAGSSFNIPTQGASATGLVVQVMESDFTATIRALETAGKLDVLSRPYILASDNQLASITVGQEVPFITASRITDQGQTINTIEYGDVGILLDVIPHINPDGLVILDVAPEISTLTGSTVPISELVAAPIIAKRSAESRVGVRNGQTIVIGGLMEDRKTQNISKIPLLGDIPLVGPLFRRTITNKAKTELLIFLTPHVASDPDDLKGMSDDEMDGTKLVPNSVAPGMFDEHYEGLRRGSTTAPVMEPTP